MKKGRRLAFCAAVVAGSVGVVLFPILLELALQRADYDESWPVFAVLAAGIVLSAGYIPFSGILQQAGHPCSQSVLFALVAGTNPIGNLALVPIWGIMGAAVATAISQALSVVYLRALVQRRIGFVL